MKRVKQASDDMRKEYMRSDFDELERGKYYERVIAKSNIVVIDPDVSTVFPNSSSVNKALHSLVDVAEKATGITQHLRNHAKRRSATKR